MELLRILFEEHFPQQFQCHCLHGSEFSLFQVLVCTGLLPGQHLSGVEALEGQRFLGDEPSEVQRFLDDEIGQVQHFLGDKILLAQRFLGER